MAIGLTTLASAFFYTMLPKITFPCSFTRKDSAYSTLLEVSPSSLLSAFPLLSGTVSITCFSSWVHDQLLVSRALAGLICASFVLLSVPSTQKLRYIFAERIDSFQRNGIVLKSWDEESQLYHILYKRWHSVKCNVTLTPIYFIKAFILSPGLMYNAGTAILTILRLFLVTYCFTRGMLLHISIREKHCWE